MISDSLDENLSWCVHEALKANDIVPAVSKAVSADVNAELQKTLQKTFTKKVVPAFENATNVMAEQIKAHFVNSLE